VSEEPVANGVVTAAQDVMEAKGIITASGLANYRGFLVYYIRTLVQLSHWIVL
jgi:hypothetical protein